MLTVLINFCLGYVSPILRKEDLFSSKYINLYIHRRKKREYRDNIEDVTIALVNKYLIGNLPRFIKRKNKIVIIDCTVLFLKFMNINYETNPGDEVFQRHFDKIIKNNIKKLNKKPLI